MPARLPGEARPNLHPFAQETSVTAQTSPWLEARKLGLTGTDAAAVLGISPWRTPLQVWAEKTGRTEPDNIGALEHVHWGNLLEPVVTAETLRRTGRQGLEPERWDPIMPAGHVEFLEHHGTTKAMLISDSHPRLRSTPDFLMESWQPLPWLDGVEILQGAGVGEIKTTSAYNLRAWADGAPLYYQVQLAMNLVTSGLEWGTFGCLVGGQVLRIFDMPVSQRMAALLVERMEGFWDRHVKADTPPAATASVKDRALLERLHPNDDGCTTELPATYWATLDAELVRIMGRQRELRTELKELETSRAAIENSLRQAIGRSTFGAVEGVATYELRTVQAEAYTVPAKTFRKLKRIPR